MIRLEHFLAALALAAGVPSWTAPMAPFRVVGDLYDVGSQGISAFALNVTRSILQAHPDVKIIVASHAHFDHAGGLAEVKKATGATLAVMDADVHWDETGTYPGRTDHTADFTPVKVDRILHDGETVSLGGETLTAHKTAGHTPGCTTCFFNVRESC